MDTKNYAGQLHEKIWTTRGSRFAAHKRLERVNILSNWAVALNSVYVITASLLAIKPFSDYSHVPLDFLSLITIFLSLIILVLSLIENAQNYKAKADSMHQCGKELNALNERLSQIMEAYDKDPEIKKEIEKIGSMYQDILNKYPDNHSANDYKSFKNEQDTNYFSQIWIWLTTFFPYYLLILIPGVVLFFIIKPR